MTIDEGPPGLLPEGLRCQTVLLVSELPRCCPRHRGFGFVEFVLREGHVIVFSDAHFWPQPRTVANTRPPMKQVIKTNQTRAKA